MCRTFFIVLVLINCSFSPHLLAHENSVKEEKQSEWTVPKWVWGSVTGVFVVGTTLFYKFFVKKSAPQNDNAGGGGSGASSLIYTQGSGAGTFVRERVDLFEQMKGDAKTTEVVVVRKKPTTQKTKTQEKEKEVTAVVTQTIEEQDDFAKAADEESEEESEEVESDSNLAPQTNTNTATSTLTPLQDWPMDLPPTLPLNWEEQWKNYECQQTVVEETSAQGNVEETPVQENTQNTEPPTSPRRVIRQVSSEECRDRIKDYHEKLQKRLEEQKRMEEEQKRLEEEQRKLNPVPEKKPSKKDLKKGKKKFGFF